MEIRTPHAPPPAGRRRPLVSLRTASRTVPLNGLPNPTGSPVYGGDGRRFGVIDDLIVDPVRACIRYVAIDVDDHLFGPTDDLRMLVPVGAVGVTPAGDALQVPALAMTTLLRVPVYRGGSRLGAAYERAVLRAFGASDRSGDAGSDAVSYAGPLFDERPFRAACTRIGRRRHGASRVAGWRSPA